MTEWTPEQKQVIDRRNSDILVSAAAGSGKTAVLTERILELVCDSEHPMDIDRLLVVTFTRAAAAEMKSRIEKKLRERLKKEPDNRHLRRQTALISHARITTIDSFCLDIVRNHFTSLDMDPDFRVADEGEMTLLKADVLEKLIEDEYQQADPDFLRFLESYCAGKTDAGLEDYIGQLYTFAESYPDPEDVLGIWEHSFDETSGTEGEWLNSFVSELHQAADEMIKICEEGLNICRMSGGPDFYEPAFSSDLSQLLTLKKKDTIEECLNFLKSVSFERLSSSRKAAADKEYAKRLRTMEKGRLESLKKDYGSFSVDELEEENRNGQSTVRVLVRLTRKFMENFSQAKRERNLMDFSDIEHLALKILTVKKQTEAGEPEKSGTSYLPSEEARELADYYQEIMTDEYQDSSRLQELILESVSGSEKGYHHMFRVGDVKQSIYMFRLARPELFMEKYHRYTSDGNEVLIELSRNFRSRAKVLEDVNGIFDSIMRESLGGIEYDKRAALYPGRIYEPLPDGKEENYEAEFLIALSSQEEETDEGQEEAADREDNELEAEMVAQRILSLTDPETGMTIWDEKKKAYRKAGYGDIVILLRSFNGMEESLSAALGANGIPVNLQSKGGYFSAYEIQVTLNFLQLIDNPRQDIPLAAVLKSPYASLSAEDLAWTKGEYEAYLKTLPAESCPEESEALFYDAVIWYSQEGKQEALKKKITRFLSLLNDFRNRSRIEKTGDLLSMLLNETGFTSIMEAMSGGERRRANLEMLIQKAADYDATSYHGLYHFVRYIEHLQKYKVDFGEADDSGVTPEAVRIMTIHKSKGLEFPICFVSGTGKRFNDRSLNGAILMHPDWGLAFNYVDPQLRVKRNTFRRKRFSQRLKSDNRGEELRVLYVAATRACEKLIFTASVRNPEKWMEKLALAENNDPKLPEERLMKASSLRDWLYEAYEKNPSCMTLKFMTPGELFGKAVLKQNEKKQRFESFQEPASLSEEEKKQLEERFRFRYPYENAIHLSGKVSVSDLKKRSMEEEDSKNLLEKDAKAFSQKHEPEQQSSVVSENESEQNSFSEQECGNRQKTAPLSASGNTQKNATLTGADRGTVYHRVMELYPMAFSDGKSFSSEKTLTEVKTAINRLNEEGFLTQEERECVREEDILRFLNSSLGRRMKKAASDGMLHRETRFVMGIPAEEIQPGCGLDDPILLQGVIDAWFEEDGNLILLDYKTDHVPFLGGEEILKRHYEIQLKLYKRALEQLTQKKVLQVYIYSFTLQKEFELYC